mmetsp:Transcript_62850/g.148845  ORF Transcript_62850/g.148845 Transcript_62850/m.148845 type:complete len:522 (+) Transcript_62850:92-1657(+)
MFVGVEANQCDGRHTETQETKLDEPVQWKLHGVVAELVWDDLRHADVDEGPCGKALQDGGGDVDIGVIDGDTNANADGSEDREEEDEGEGFALRYLVLKERVAEGEGGDGLVRGDGDEQRHHLLSLPRHSERNPREHRVQTQRRKEEVWGQLRLHRALWLGGVGFERQRLRAGPLQARVEGRSSGGSTRRCGRCPRCHGHADRNTGSLLLAAELGDALRCLLEVPLLPRGDGLHGVDILKHHALRRVEAVGHGSRSLDARHGLGCELTRHRLSGDGGHLCAGGGERGVGGGDGAHRHRGVLVIARHKVGNIVLARREHGALAVHRLVHAHLHERNLLHQQHKGVSGHDADGDHRIRVALGEEGHRSSVYIELALRDLVLGCRLGEDVGDARRHEHTAGKGVGPAQVALRRLEDLRQHTPNETTGEDEEGVADLFPLKIFFLAVAVLIFVVVMVIRLARDKLGAPAAVVMSSVRVLLARGLVCGLVCVVTVVVVSVRMACMRVALGSERVGDGCAVKFRGAK